MKYCVYGDLLTIYLDDVVNVLDENERNAMIAEIIEKNAIEWIVLDCNKIETLESWMLSLIERCTAMSFNVIAVNANLNVANWLSFCFIDVSLGFYYTPDANKKIIILEDNNIDKEFLSEQLQGLIEKKFEKLEEAVFEKISEITNDKGTSLMWLEMEIVEESVYIDIFNKTTGECGRVTKEMK